MDLFLSLPYTKLKLLCNFGPHKVPMACIKDTTRKSDLGESIYQCPRVSRSRGNRVGLFRAYTSRNFENFGRGAYMISQYKSWFFTVFRNLGAPRRYLSIRPKWPYPPRNTKIDFPGEKMSTLTWKLSQNWSRVNVEKNFLFTITHS